MIRLMILFFGLFLNIPMKAQNSLEMKSEYKELQTPPKKNIPSLEMFIHSVDSCINVVCVSVDELENESFIRIEYSKDGVNFFGIFKIQEIGVHQMMNKVYDEISYYRLMIVSKEGNKKILKIIKVSNECYYSKEFAK